MASTFAPPSLARDAACVPIRRLTRLGGHTVFVELGSRCAERAPNAAARWVAIVDAAAGARVRLAATIADPTGAPDPRRSSGDRDRDHDGRDDVALQVSLEGGGAPLEPGPRVSAVLAFLDRPAGLSRDASATEASFAALADVATARAARSKEAGGVPGYAAQARALWRAVCSDGAAPRLVAVAGVGSVTCGGARALEAVGLAEVKAYVTLGDPLRAALALERSTRGIAVPSAHAAAEAAEARKWVSQYAPAAAARLLRSVAAVPMAPRPREVAWGALAFEPSGKLLVRTRAGVVRVDPDVGDESASGTAEWPSAVMSPDGAFRWIEAYDPCDGLPLHATFELASGSDERDIALPVPAPPSGRCAGSRGAPARVIPVAWGPSGLEAIVEGEPVLVSNDLGARVAADVVSRPAGDAGRAAFAERQDVRRPHGHRVSREGRPARAPLARLGARRHVRGAARLRRQRRRDARRLRPRGQGVGRDVGRALTGRPWGRGYLCAQRTSSASRVLCEHWTSRSAQRTTRTPCARSTGSDALEYRATSSRGVVAVQPFAIAT